MRAHPMRFRAVATLLLACLTPSIQAASPTSKDRKKNTDSQVVDLMSAVNDGQIEVKFIPKDATRATLLVTNKSQEPISVRLPAAFAGVPVLAQVGNFFGQGQGQGNPFGGQGNPFGGGGGGGGQGLGMNNQQNGGMWNVAPEKVCKIKVDAVCLDHGKPDPSPRMKYQIVPIQDYVSKPEVVELLKMMGRGDASRVAVQAAVWNLNNGKSWKQLAAMRRGPKRLTGGRAPYFSRETLKRAAKLAEIAQEKARKSQKSKSKSSSLASH